MKAETNFVRFLQPPTIDTVGLTALQVQLFTDKGELYLMCPLLLGSMVFPSEAYESIIEYLTEAVDQQEANYEIRKFLTDYRKSDSKQIAKTG